MLTIWDTAALLSLVLMSTIKALNFPFTVSTDISFVLANCSRMSPLGHYTSRLSFSNGGRRSTGVGHSASIGANRMFVERFYVVDNALFQLLLGIRFLYRHWANILFP